MSGFLEISPIHYPTTRELFAAGLPWVDVRTHGAKGDGVTDETDAFQRALNKCTTGTLHFPGTYIIRRKLTITGEQFGGGLIFQGSGAANYTTPVPGASKGSVLVWDGDPTDDMFQIGNDSHFRWNVIMKDFSVMFNKGIKRFANVSSVDSFQAKNMLFNGFSNRDIRGVFDFHNHANNVRCEQNTMYDIPAGYGFRQRDASANHGYYQNFLQRVALEYWIGDGPVAVDDYPTSLTTIEDATFEGVSGIGKFSVNTLSADAYIGEKQVALTNASAFAVNDPIYIGRGANNFEMTYITTKVVNTLTLAHPLAFDHLAGEIVKAGTIGIHVGESGPASGRSRNIILRRPMFDRKGCGIDANRVETLKIENPDFISYMSCGMFFDGSVQNIVLINPASISASQNADWRIFEITSRGLTYNFMWLNSADKSGKNVPYINSQGEIDGLYIGSFQQTEGTSDMPPYFRGIISDSMSGITLRETSGASGFHYNVGERGSVSELFCIVPADSGGDLKGDVIIFNRIRSKTGIIKTDNKVEVADNIKTDGALEGKYGIIVHTPDMSKRYRIWIDDSGNITSTLVV